MSICRHCGDQIGWKREGTGWKPTDAAGLPHKCTRARRRVLITIPPDAPITGAKYTPSCGECDVPPWEECACSARLAA